MIWMETAFQAVNDSIGSPVYVILFVIELKLIWSAIRGSASIESVVAGSSKGNVQECSSPELSDSDVSSVVKVGGE